MIQTICFDAALKIYVSATGLFLVGFAVILLLIAMSEIDFYFLPMLDHSLKTEKRKKTALFEGSAKD